MQPVLLGSSPVQWGLGHVKVPTVHGTTPALTTPFWQVCKCVHANVLYLVRLFGAAMLTHADTLQ